MQNSAGLSRARGTAACAVISMSERHSLRLFFLNIRLRGIGGGLLPPTHPLLLLFLLRPRRASSLLLRPITTTAY